MNSLLMRARLSKPVMIVLIYLGLQCVALPAVSQAAGSDDYPYSNSVSCATQCQADEWGFYKRECTSFVAWRLNHDNGMAFRNSGFGNADNWGDRAAQLGYRVDKTPAVGAVAWWSSGHVAWVSNVQGSSVTIEEYNFNYNHLYHQRVIAASSVSGYIHMKDMSGPGAQPSAAKPSSALLKIQMNQTGSGHTEVHSLTRASDFQHYDRQLATTVGTTDAYPTRWVSGDFNGDHVNDLMRVVMTGTSSRRTEVHILDGAHDFSERGDWHFATPMGELNPSIAHWVALDYDHDGRDDLALIMDGGTGSGRTEVHVLSAGSNFQNWIVHAATPDSYTNWNETQYVAGDFNRDGKPDIAGIHMTGTGSRRTEVHILDGSKGYVGYIDNLHCALSKEGYMNTNENQWVGSDYNQDGLTDLVKVQTGSTGSGRTEVHIYSPENCFGRSLLDTATPESLTNATHSQWVSS